MLVALVSVQSQGKLRLPGGEWFVCAPLVRFKVSSLDLLPETSGVLLSCVGFHLLGQVASSYPRAVRAGFIVVSQRSGSVDVGGN